MTAFAGSIGIIGIAAILCARQRREQLHQVRRGGHAVRIPVADPEHRPRHDVHDAGSSRRRQRGRRRVRRRPAKTRCAWSKMLTNMLSSIGSNDLAALKQYFDSGESDIDQYTNAIEYSYNATPQIYSSNTEKRAAGEPGQVVHVARPRLHQQLEQPHVHVHVDRHVLRDAERSRPVSEPVRREGRPLARSGRTRSCWCSRRTAPSATSCCTRWACATPAELDRHGGAVRGRRGRAKPPTTCHPYSYDDILSVTFKLVNAADFYQHDEEFGVWKDKTDDKDFVRSTWWRDGEDLHVVGVVQPREDASGHHAERGAVLPRRRSLRHVIDEAAASADREGPAGASPTSTCSRASPSATRRPTKARFNMDSLFTIDGDAIQAAFTIDESKLAVDMSSALNLQGSLQNMPAAARAEHGRDRRLARHRPAGRPGRRRSWPSIMQQSWRTCRTTRPRASTRAIPERWRRR